MLTIAKASTSITIPLNLGIPCLAAQFQQMESALRKNFSFKFERMHAALLRSKFTLTLDDDYTSFWAFRRYYMKYQLDYKHVFFR